MAFAHKLSLGVVNCLSGEYKQGQSSPFVIGSGAESDMVLNDDSILDQHCVIEKTKKGIQLRSIQPEHPDGGIVLDGNPTTLVQLKARTEHSIQVGKSFLIIVTTMSPKKENIQMWGANIKNGGWIIINPIRRQPPALYKSMRFLMPVIAWGLIQIPLQFLKGVVKLVFILGN